MSCCVQYPQELEIRTLLNEERKDMETRQAQHLQQIATMFSQTIKSQRVANAEVQTATHGITPRHDDKMTGHSASAVQAGIGMQVPTAGVRQQVVPQVLGGDALDASGRMEGRVSPKDHGVSSRTDDDAELYSTVFDSADRTAQDLLFPSKVTELQILNTRVSSWSSCFCEWETPADKDFVILRSLNAVFQERNC